MSDQHNCRVDDSIERTFRSRRSRIRRTRTGKRLELTSRDLEIFRTLARYRYLRSTYLHAFAGGASAKRFKERLGDLFHEGYLDRPHAQWHLVNARYMPLVYENSEAARDVLQQTGEPPDSAHGRNGGTRQFAHALMILEILASIELGTRASSRRLRFIPWREILAKAPEGTRVTPHPHRIPITEGEYLVPDAMFGLEYLNEGRKAYRFFALEADRATMPVQRSSAEQSSYRKKVLAYQQVAMRQIHRTHVGVPNLLVLTVTLSEARKASMLAEAKTTAAGVGNVFLFKAVAAIGNLPMLGLLTEPWERAGHPAISIASPS